MAPLESDLTRHYDERLRTLARIKARSIGADPLTLAALTVLTYAQLEGGIKDLAARVIKEVNLRRMKLGDVSPELLQWRNESLLPSLRNFVDFNMIGATTPFDAQLQQIVEVMPINRRFELNQMNWDAVARVYGGFCLDPRSIERLASTLDQLVETRNQVAHHGSLAALVALLENQLRSNVAAVEDVLTDLTLQLLEFFPRNLHMRTRTPTVTV